MEQRVAGGACSVRNALCQPPGCACRRTAASIAQVTRCSDEEIRDNVIFRAIGKANRKHRIIAKCIPDCTGEDPLRFTKSAVDLQQLMTQLQPALVCTLHDE